MVISHCQPIHSQVKSSKRTGMAHKAEEEKKEGKPKEEKNQGLGSSPFGKDLSAEEEEGQERDKEAGAAALEERVVVTTYIDWGRE